MGIINNISFSKLVNERFRSPEREREILVKKIQFIRKRAAWKFNIIVPRKLINKSEEK